MSNALESQKIASEKKGWKGLLIAFILSVFFLGFFYLAVTNEPDYMPSQKNKAATQQTAPTAEQNATQTHTDDMKNMEHTQNQHNH